MNLLVGSQGAIMMKGAIARYIRSHAAAQLYDESGVSPEGIAIYTLSDPRDLRAVRYVGQTVSPRRRLLQHLNTARLWLLADTPWWVKDPKLRPLSVWIRALYLADLRLPTMIVCEWCKTAFAARAAERGRIAEYLRDQRLLLNVECEQLGKQFQLL